MDTGKVATLPSDWLNSTNDIVTTTGTTHLMNTTACIQTWPYQGWTYSYYPAKIRLTLSEVDRLRKAAKADDKLKAVLEKFTSQIEVIVDLS